MENISKLNILGFHLNTSMVSEIDSVYYDNDENEDDWIEIIPDSLVDNSYVIIIVVGGVNKKVFAFDGDNEQLEKLLSVFLKEIYV